MRYSNTYDNSVCDFSLLPRLFEYRFNGLFYKTEFNVDQLRSKIDEKAIDEEIFVDQRDIEELDSVDAFKNGLVEF